MMAQLLFSPPTRPRMWSKRKGRISETRYFCPSQLANKQRHPFHHKSRKLLASAHSSVAGLTVLAFRECSTNCLQSSQKNSLEHETETVIVANNQSLTSFTSSVTEEYREITNFQKSGNFGACAMQKSPGSLFCPHIIRDPGYEATCGLCLGSWNVGCAMAVSRYGHRQGMGDVI